MAGWRIPDDERWRDNHRDNQAGARGIETTRYGWRDVDGHACETAALLAADPEAARLDGNAEAVLRALPGGARWPGGSGVTTAAELE